MGFCFCLSHEAGSWWGPQGLCWENGSAPDFCTIQGEVARVRVLRCRVPRSQGVSLCGLEALGNVQRVMAAPSSSRPVWNRITRVKGRRAQPGALLLTVGQLYAWPADSPPYLPGWAPGPHRDRVTQAWESPLLLMFLLKPLRENQQGHVHIHSAFSRSWKLRLRAKSLVQSHTETKEQRQSWSPMCRSSPQSLRPLCLHCAVCVCTLVCVCRHVHVCMCVCVCETLGVWEPLTGFL